MLNNNLSSVQRSALCIIVETKGSTPRKTGTKMRVFDDGKIEGTIGGGSFEKKVIEDALKQIKCGTPRLFEHHLLQEHEMCCGGSIKVYIEPVVPKKQLYIFGAGHVGQELALLAHQANFDVTVIDDRKEYLDQVADGQIKTELVSFEQALGRIQFTENTFIAILTYRHDIDRMILRYCLKRDWAYLGFIGSQRKIIITKKMIVEENLATMEDLERVDMPIGLPIGAETPFEIAVSIISKMISVKNSERLISIQQIKDIEQCVQKLQL